MVISRILKHNITFNPINEICGDSPVELSDCDLMLAAANDDMEAYNKLYAKYRKPLYNYILRHILNAQTAEDIFQETFLRLYKSRKSYKPTAKFSVYLYTIAHRLCINQAKKNKRWSFVTHLSSLLYKGKDENAPVVEDIVESSEPLPMEELCKAEMDEVLKQALLQLSEAHRTAFVLFEIQSFSYKEIADITETHIGTVKSRLNNARKQLRELLKDYLK